MPNTHEGPHEVKEGAKFRLFEREWTVVYVSKCMTPQQLHSTSPNWERREDNFSIWLPLSDAPLLEWVKEEPTCSPAFAKAFMNETRIGCECDDVLCMSVRDFLTAHTAKDAE